MKIINGIIFFIIAQGMIYLIGSVASWTMHFTHWTDQAIALVVLLTLLNLAALFTRKK